MSSERNNRGVSRVLNKLENAISSGNYYEAHQMYRTLYFRYVAQKKYDECLDLLYRGAMTFFKKEQYSSGADLTSLVIDTLEKAKDQNIDNELWMTRIGILISKMNSNVVERDGIIARAIKWSADISRINLGHPMMHKLIAQTMWSEGNIEQARHHYLLSRDGISCGQMLVQLSQTKGYPSETDLFIAQMVLQQLCLKETKTALETFETYTKYHPRIASTEPPFIMPLLNFIFFLLKSIESGRLVAFKSLCELYKASIDRDPSYEKYLQKIGALFFGIVPPQQPGMDGLLGNLFNRLFQGMTDDDDDDDHDHDNSGNHRNQISVSKNNKTNRTTSSELD